MSRRIKCVAFTLVELLVVIGVIMTLAAILMPALSRAKELGRATRCAANLHHLQLAALNYAGGGAGSLPPAVSSWSGNSEGTLWTHSHGWVAWAAWSGSPGDTVGGGKPIDGTYAWQDATAAKLGTACITNGSLWSLVGEKNVYLCPTFGQKNVCLVNVPVRSYSMNSAVSGASMLAIKTPVNTVLFGDDRNLNLVSVDSQFATNEIGSWHRGAGGVGAGLVVFVDGHVEKR